jgi:hypothetical protein
MHPWSRKHEPGDPNWLDLTREATRRGVVITLTTRGHFIVWRGRSTMHCVDADSARAAVKVLGGRSQ